MSLGTGPREAWLERGEESLSQIRKEFGQQGHPVLGGGSGFQGRELPGEGFSPFLGTERKMHRVHWTMYFYVNITCRPWCYRKQWLRDLLSGNTRGQCGIMQEPSVLVSSHSLHGFGQVSAQTLEQVLTRTPLTWGHRVFVVCSMYLTCTSDKQVLSK